MLKSSPNLKPLQDLVHACFGRQLELHFSVGNDPKLKERREAEARDLEEVKTNPKVQFILKQFNGSILKCTRLDTSKE